MRRLAADGYGGPAAAIERHASLHYQGQTYELTVAVPDGPLDNDALAALEEAFGAEHERTYGHRRRAGGAGGAGHAPRSRPGPPPRRAAAPYRAGRRVGVSVSDQARLFRPGARLVRGVP